MGMLFFPPFIVVFPTYLISPILIFGAIVSPSVMSNCWFAPIYLISHFVFSASFFSPICIGLLIGCTPRSPSSEFLDWVSAVSSFAACWLREFVRHRLPELEAANPFCPLIVDKFDPGVAEPGPFLARRVPEGE